MAERGKLPRAGGFRVRGGCQVQGAATQIDVLGQHADDQRVGLAMPGEGRQRQHLLRAGMARAFALEEVEKDTARLPRILLLGALELKRRNQAMPGTPKLSRPEAG